MLIIKVVFHALNKYKLQSILGPAFKLFEALLELIVPLVVADIIDVGINTGDVSYIIGKTVLLIVLGLAGLAFAVTAQYFSAQAAVGSATAIRHDLYKKLHSFSYTQIDNMGTSTMITRMTSDVNQVQTGINLVLRLVLRSPFVVFGAMIMAFTVNAKLALIFAVIIPVLMIVVLLLMIYTVPLYKKVQTKLDSVLSASRENLNGVRVIRSFCRENAEISDYNKRNGILNRLQNTVGMISAIMNPMTFIIINIGIILLLNNGAVLIDNSELSGGQLVALYNYMSQILVELIKLAGLIITVTKSVASANRISAVMNMPGSNSEVSEKFDNDGSVIFSDVSFRYDGVGEYSLEGIDFTAEKGEKVGIVGGTGSGKTTLINLISAFYLPTCGKITVGGHDTSEWNTSQLVESVGIVPQKTVLFQGTIRDNILWGNPGADDDTVMKAVRLAQAEDVIGSKEAGLDEMIEQGGRNLSGGQRQRLAIARAVIKQPSILILDDSSSALDYATDSRLRKSLASIKDTTVFIVSQRASSVIGCDKIIVLDDGRQVGYGTHEQLLENCEVYSEIYYSQFERAGESAV